MAPSAESFLCCVRNSCLRPARGVVTQVLLRRRSGRSPSGGPGTRPSRCRRLPLPCPSSSAWAGLPGSPACPLLQFPLQPQRTEPQTDGSLLRPLRRGGGCFQVAPRLRERPLAAGTKRKLGWALRFRCAVSWLLWVGSCSRRGVGGGGTWRAPSCWVDGPRLVPLGCRVDRDIESCLPPGRTPEHPLWPPFLRVGGSARPRSAVALAERSGRPGPCGISAQGWLEAGNEIRAHDV